MPITKHEVTKMNKFKKVFSKETIDPALSDLEDDRIKYNIEHEIKDPPTLLQVQKEIERKQFSVDANKFINYYTKKNWVNQFDDYIYDWRKTLQGWEASSRRQQNEKTAASGASTLNNDELWYMKPSDYLYTRAWYIKNHINTTALKICRKIYELRQTDDQSTRVVGFLHTYDLLYGYFGWLTQTFDFENKKCIFNKEKEESFETISKIECLKKRIEKSEYPLTFGNFESLDDSIKHQIENQNNSVRRSNANFDSINIFTEL